MTFHSYKTVPEIKFPLEVLDLTSQDNPELEIVYTNHKGVKSTRRIKPLRRAMWYGSTPHHPNDQWFMHAWDTEKNCERDFAWNNIEHIQKFYPTPAKCLVLYHANCIDGFTAAWVFHQFGPSTYTDYKPVTYDENIDDFLVTQNYKEKTNLYILDFSFSKVVLKRLAAQFNLVVLLDHHKTAHENLSDWNDENFEDKPANLTLIIDQEKSGAGLAFEYFNKSNICQSSLVDYVQDRDLWKFELPYSIEINEVIKATDQTFDSYSNLNSDISSNFLSTVQKGDLLAKQNSRHVTQIATQVYYHPFPDGTQIAVVNCPAQFASDVGNFLCHSSKVKYAVCFYHANDWTKKISLRSAKHSNVDVSEIAKKFGGGGHKNAAGFSCKLHIGDLLMRLDHYHAQ